MYITSLFNSVELERERVSLNGFVAIIRIVIMFDCTLNEIMGARNVIL